MRKYRGEEHRRFVRGLRANMTDAEKVIWSRVRAKRFFGYPMRRQVPISIYVVDFLCPSKRLIVELDGAQHDAARDAKRDARMEELGYRTIRFTNHDVMTNLDGVLSTLKVELDR